MRVPTCYGFYHRTRGILRNGQSLSSTGDLALLLARLPNGVVVKPIDGSHGHGVIVIVGYDTADGRLKRAGGGDLSLDDLVAQLDESVDGWVVQERIVQHPALAALHPQSVNTVRLVTLCGDDGMPSAIASISAMSPDRPCIFQLPATSFLSAIQVPFGGSRSRARG